MTDDRDRAGRVVLIAHLRAYLTSGGSFDLVPIEDSRDVKGAVESLLRSWAESGFLVHGRFVYPWHQVQHIEVLQVEEREREAEAANVGDRTRAQEAFWRTR